MDSSAEGIGELIDGLDRELNGGGSVGTHAMATYQEIVNTIRRMVVARLQQEVYRGPN